MFILRLVGKGVVDFHSPLLINWTFFR